MKKLSDLLNNNPVARFSFDTPNVLFTQIKKNKPEKIPGTEGSPHMPISLVRTSLLRFLKILHKYLLYVNFGLFFSLVRFFGQKNSQKSHKGPFTNYVYMRRGVGGQKIDFL